MVFVRNSCVTASFLKRNSGNSERRVSNPSITTDHSVGDYRFSRGVSYLVFVQLHLLVTSCQRLFKENIKHRTYSTIPWHQLNKNVRAYGKKITFTPSWKTRFNNKLTLFSIAPNVVIFLEWICIYICFFYLFAAE